MQTVPAEPDHEQKPRNSGNYAYCRSLGNRKDNWLSMSIQYWTLRVHFYLSVLPSANRRNEPSQSSQLPTKHVRIEEVRSVRGEKHVRIEEIRSVRGEKQTSSLTPSISLELYAQCHIRVLCHESFFGHQTQTTDKQTPESLGLGNQKRRSGSPMFMRNKKHGRPRNRTGVSSDVEDF